MTNTQLARFVRKRREEMNLTQLELSEMLGIAQTQLSALENGKHSPRLDTMAEIVDKLGAKIKLVPKN